MPVEIREHHNHAEHAVSMTMVAGVRNASALILLLMQIDIAVKSGAKGT